MAACFLIIGRCGIRVGDRISIAGLTGDVVDVGLVGTDPDLKAAVTGTPRIRTLMK